MCNEEWDFDNPQVQEPVKKPRAVVSVSIPREDFEKVVDEARKRGMKTSVYIRKMALNQLWVPNVLVPSIWVGDVGSYDTTTISTPQTNWTYVTEGGE